MNDYYLCFCDLESDSKEEQELDIFDTWLTYEPQYLEDDQQSEYDEF
jgi:hypothetical protein